MIRSLILSLVLAASALAQPWLKPSDSARFVPTGAQAITGIPSVTPTKTVTTFQAGHGYTVSGTGATGNVNDTSANIMGSQCATVTTAGTGIQSSISNNAVTAFTGAGQCLRVLVKVDNIAHLQKMSIYAGDTALANFVVWIAQTTNTTTLDANVIQSGRWCWVTLNWADATTTGTPTRTAITCLRMAVYDDNTGNPVTAHIQAIQTVPDGSAIFPSGVCSIVFDDGFLSQHTIARPILDAAGFPATTYIIASIVGSSGRVTLANLQDAQDISGWEVSGHAATLSNHNARFPNLSASALSLDAHNLRTWLATNGFRGAGIAYPGGSFTAATTTTLRRFFAYGRTIAGTPHETIPPADLFALRATSSISSSSGGTSIASLTTTTTGAIDVAVANKQWLILVFHDISSGAATSTTQCAAADFQTVVTKLASAGIPVMTVRDVLAKLR